MDVRPSAAPPLRDLRTFDVIEAIHAMARPTPGYLTQFSCIFLCTQLRSHALNFTLSPPQASPRSRANCMPSTVIANLDTGVPSIRYLPALGHSASRFQARSPAPDSAALSANMNTVRFEFLTFPLANDPVPAKAPQNYAFFTEEGFSPVLFAAWTAWWREPEEAQSGPPAKSREVKQQGRIQPCNTTQAV